MECHRQAPFLSYLLAHLFTPVAVSLAFTFWSVLTILYTFHGSSCRYLPNNIHTLSCALDGDSEINENGFVCVLNYAENTNLQIVVNSLWEFLNHKYVIIFSDNSPPLKRSIP